MGTPSVSGSTSRFFGNHAKVFVFTLNAGNPNVVPSSTSANLATMRRTRAILFIKDAWLGLQQGFDLERLARADRRERRTNELSDRRFVDAVRDALWTG